MIVNTWMIFSLYFSSITQKQVKKLTLLILSYDYNYQRIIHHHIVTISHCCWIVIIWYNDHIYVLIKVAYNLMLASYYFKHLLLKNLRRIRSLYILSITNIYYNILDHNNHHHCYVTIKDSDVHNTSWFQY
jgi:hypothetical protein